MNSLIQWMADFSEQSRPAANSDAPPSDAFRPRDSGTRYRICVISNGGTDQHFWAGVCEGSGRLIWSRQSDRALAFLCPFTADALAGAIAVSARRRRDSVIVVSTP